MEPNKAPETLGFIAQANLHNLIIKRTAKYAFSARGFRQRGASRREERRSNNLVQAYRELVLDNC